MNGKDLLVGLSFVDEAYVDEAETRTMKKPSPARWIPWVAIAACLCLVIAGGRLLAPGLNGSDESLKNYSGIGESESGVMGSEEGVEEGRVAVPRLEVDLNPMTSANLLAFFIYQGRSYVCYEELAAGEALVGEYLGTSVGAIDEWTPLDGYVELAGSVSGDFYAVKGYDPSFMLCMKNGDGSVVTYINDNGITLGKGAELYEDRLHLSGNYTSVDFQTRADWFYGTGVMSTIAPEHQPIVDQFLAAVNEADFIYSRDIPLEEGETSIYDDKEIYHLFFRMNNGMSTHLRLLEGGYVQFQGLTDVSVKIDQAVFDSLIGVLSE